MLFTLKLDTSLQGAKVYLVAFNPSEKSGWPLLVGNEGPSTFTGWYIYGWNFPHSLRVGPARNMNLPAFKSENPTRRMGSQVSYGGDGIPDHPRREKNTKKCHEWKGNNPS